jgi:ribosomal protein L16 Arg81 hydroxylase
VADNLMIFLSSWKLHEPKEDLPNYCSTDLDPSIIGEPVLEVLLEKGDILVSFS